MDERQLEALKILYKRGDLNPTRKAAVDELVKRGVITLDDRPPVTPEHIEMRKGAIEDVVKDIWPTTAFAISVGKGVENVGRGLGILPEPSERSEEGMDILEKEYPKSTGAGEMVGEAVPFMLPGAGIAKIASVPLRIAAGAGLGAGEGAVLSNAEGKDPMTGAGLGAAFSASAEILFPVLGRMGRAIYQRVKGAAPKGAMLDAAGRPTQEFQTVLDESGVNFDDLTQDAVDLIEAQQSGVNPRQALLAAQAKELNVPLTKGDLTQRYEQQAIENSLLESSMDKHAEPFRQFKLRQSEAIKKVLRDNFDLEYKPGETGELIQKALDGRVNLLRTKKNELYKEASESAKDLGGLPIFTDNIRAVVPDADTFEDMAITSEGPIKAVEKLLVKYGIKDPPADIADTFEPKQLTIDNFERFRKNLLAIERGDATRTASNIVRPIVDALDRELDEVDNILGGVAEAAKVRDTLKQARSTVRTMKTEFDPQGLTAKLINDKKGGVTAITEASQVYDKLVGRSSPFEQTKKVLKSLRKSPNSEQAIAALETTTMMDLIDAGFSTNTRKIDGVNTFNPIAFQNRLKAIGDGKLRVIFKDSPGTFKKIKDLEKLSKSLVPPSGAVPKGSATKIQDIVNRLGLLSITGKLPGAAAIEHVFRSKMQDVQTKSLAKKAQEAIPELMETEGFINNTFPGIASALGISATINDEEETNDE